MSKSMFEDIQNRNKLCFNDAVLVTMAIECLPDDEIRDIAIYYTLWISYRPNVYARRFIIRNHIQFVITLTDNFELLYENEEKAIKTILHEIAHCVDASYSEEDADKIADIWYNNRYNV